MVEILRRPRAKNDIKKISRYTYENWGDKQADIYTKELGQVIDGMADNPMTGANIDYVRKGYRLYHFKRHLVIYRVT
jgi:toxin ParE1/3/4